MKEEENHPDLVLLAHSAAANAHRVSDGIAELFPQKRIPILKFQSPIEGTLLPEAVGRKMAVQDREAGIEGHEFEIQGTEG